MDFHLNEEQLHLKKSVREFAEREIAPNIMKWDEACEFPLATIKELGKLGLMGTIFSASHAVSADNVVLEYAGDSLEVAEGADGWQQMHYFCTFDSAAGTTRDVSLRKGDIPDE